MLLYRKKLFKWFIKILLNVLYRCVCGFNVHLKMRMKLEITRGVLTKNKFARPYWFATLSLSPINIQLLFMIHHSIFNYVKWFTEHNYCFMFWLIENEYYYKQIFDKIVQKPILIVYYYFNWLVLLCNSGRVFRSLTVRQ